MEHSFKSRTSLPFVASGRKSSASSIYSSRKSIHGGMKKPIGTSSRYSVSGRSVQSNQIIARSTNNVAQMFGLQLPITVNEALMFSERNANVTINCSDNGWAWAICGRKLLVWQYKDTNVTSPKAEMQMRTPQRRPVISQCRELTLPHCDIGHKASLITVFTTEGQQMASCLSISPTGDVRFWPSIAHDAISIDESGILEGQEFDELVTIPSVGYVLVTTTCNLVLLQLQLNNGRYSISHKDVRPPTGFLGGIGKRFASILIGSNQHDRENRFIKMCAKISESSDWYVSVLSDKFIQRWSIELNFNETFLFEDQNIIPKIKQAFHQHAWPSRDINEVEMFTLDMHPNKNGELILLVAAMNLAHTPQILFSLVTLVEQQSCFAIKDFCQMKTNAFYSGDANEESLKYKFILTDSTAFVYGERTIFEVLLSNVVQQGVDNTEKIELPTPNDRILAAAVYSQIPIFFSRLNGFISISSSDFGNMDCLNSSVVSEMSDFHMTSQTMHNETATNLTIYDVNPEEVYNLNDSISQIKAAFIYHLKKNTSKCSAIINQLFSSGSTLTASDFDNIIVKIAKDLAEDIPAADPRWEEQLSNSKCALGSSTSLQIIQQLKEKNRAFTHFIEFLQATQLWEKLDTVTERSQIKATCHLLADISEKIIAAIALKGIHNTYAAIIDSTLDITLKKRNEIPPENLTSQDIFYVQVTRIHEFFKSLSIIADEVIQQEQIPAKASQHLLDISQIVLTVLHEVFKFREAKSAIFKLPADKVRKFEYLPWTGAAAPHGIRDSVLHIINIIMKNGVRSTAEPELRQQHFKNLVELVDFYLDGRKAYLESIKELDKYETLFRKYEAERSDLIFNFVDGGQFELAAKLAEKYLDFKTLVVICDQTKNQARLEEYIDRYRDQDFSQFAINWHLQQNKRGDLFERFKRNQNELTRFLGDHPSLEWIQTVFNGDLSRASRILLQLANGETDSVSRKRTMLSLAKLTSLAGDDELSNEIEAINVQLQLIDYQFKVPTRMLQIFGYDPDNQQVLKPEEIINLYIAEENIEVDEEYYHKALSLTPFVEDPLDIKHKIWCSAILHNAWDSYNVNAPLETVQNYMIYKLIDLCIILYADLDEFLPPLQELLDAPELGSLVESKSFQFLLKLIYEYFYDTYKKTVG